MIERNNPDIDVDDLMLRVQSEASRRRYGDDAVLFAAPTSARLDTTMFESQLSIAQQRAEVRQALPQRLEMYPFGKIPWLQRIALRGFNLLFKDQRQVNFALIAASRELLQINRDLSERLSELESQIQGLRTHGGVDALPPDG